MPVKNVTHDADGELMTTVPVTHKIALGLPRGYVDPDDGSTLQAPMKLFHFLAQSRDAKGDWQPDDDLHKVLFGDVHKPRSLNIRLVGNNIDDMIVGDLFYWSGQVGRKCSCGTTKSYMQMWCEQNGVAWEEPLSKVQSQVELEMLIGSKDIPAKMADFIKYAEEFAASMMKVRDFDSSYAVGVDDVLNASMATRHKVDRYKPFPCMFRQCPDYIGGDCKFNGRFYFSIPDHDHGVITHLVTTSPKNIKQLQYGLSKMISPAAKHGLNGVHCRLVGEPTRGSYMHKGKQHKTTFFLVSLLVSKGDPVVAGRKIAQESKDNYEIYGDVRVSFQEADDEQLAKERRDEFHEHQEIKIDGEGQTTGDFDIKDDKGHTTETVIAKGVYSNHIKEVVENNRLFTEDDVLRQMVIKYAEEVSGMPDSAWARNVHQRFEQSVIKQQVTVEKILKSAEGLANHDVTFDFAEYHKGLLKKAEKKNGQVKKEDKPAAKSKKPQPAKKAGATKTSQKGNGK